MEQLFASLPPDYRTLGANQYISILHTRISSSRNEDGVQIAFDFDDYYCAYFGNHPSSWQLWISDPLRKQLSSARLQLSIDSQPLKISATDFATQTLTIDLPSGTGTHTWKLETVK
jgi:hypothetical protein